MSVVSTPEVSVEVIDPCVRDTTPAVFRLTARGTATEPGVPATTLDFQSAERIAVGPSPDAALVPAVQQRVRVWIEPTRGRWISGRGNPRYEHNIVAAHTIYMNTTQGPRVLFFSPSRQGDPNTDSFVPRLDGMNGGWEWEEGNAHKMEIKLWDPLSGALQIQPSQHFAGKGINLFCSGHALLPDGRTVAAGGHVGLSSQSSRWVHMFDPERPLGSRIARAAGQMVDSRWYPTTTVLPSGRVLIASGNHVALAYTGSPNGGLITPGYINGSEARTEIFDPAANSLVGIPRVYISDTNQGLYPALFVLPSSRLSDNPNGGSFLARQGALFHFERKTAYLFQIREGEDGNTLLFPGRLLPDMAGLPRCPTAAPFFCERAPIFPVYATKHTGSRGFPTYGSAVLLPLNPTDGRKARVLVVGGQRTPNRDPFAWDIGNPTTNSAEIFDYDADQEIDRQSGWRTIAPMQANRILPDATLLADGNVFVSGGARSGWSNDPGMAVFEGELFDSTSETWFTTEPSPTERRYHSTAFLQDDGTVVKTGSHGGFSSGASNIVPQFHSDIFVPPYLFRATRPVLEAVDGPSLTPGHTSRVWMHGGSQNVIASSDEVDQLRVGIVRVGGVTHGFHMDQRFVWLPVESTVSLSVEDQNQETRTRVRLVVRVPDDRATVVPGHYMVFVLSRHGVPSIARFVVFR
jgi:hypothetical protein